MEVFSFWTIQKIVRNSELFSFFLFHNLLEIRFSIFWDRLNSLGNPISKHSCWPLDFPPVIEKVSIFWNGLSIVSNSYTHLDFEYLFGQLIQNQVCEIEWRWNSARNFNYRILLDWIHPFKSLTFYVYWKGFYL